MVDLKNLGKSRDKEKQADSANVPAPAASGENAPKAGRDAKPASPSVDLAALAAKATDVETIGKVHRTRATKDTGPLPLEAEVLATIDTGKAKAIPVPTLDFAKEVMNAVRRVGNRHDKGTKVRVYDVSTITAENPDGTLVQYRRDKAAKAYFWSDTDGNPYAGAGPFSVRFQATAERAKRNTNGGNNTPATANAPSSANVESPASAS
jgi:hypothetical protein